MSPEERYTEGDLNKALFAHLVMSLATSTMQHLGKIVNPATKKAEINLDAAQSTIDMLDMLETKTRGNLDPEETQFVKSTLATLKLNFVETTQSAPPPPASSSPGVAETPRDEAPKPESGESADSKKKYHKKYE